MHQCMFLFKLTVEHAKRLVGNHVTLAIYNLNNKRLQNFQDCRKFELIQTKLWALADKEGIACLDCLL